MEQPPAPCEKPEPWPEARDRLRRAGRALALLLLALMLGAVAAGWRRTLRASVPRRPAALRALPVTVDVAEADAARLVLLPGIGPVRARAILEHRARHGPPRRLEDLQRVAGLGPATIAGLRHARRVRVAVSGQPVGCGDELPRRSRSRDAPP